MQSVSGLQENYWHPVVVLPLAVWVWMRPRQKPVQIRSMCSCSSPLSGHSPTAPEPDRRNKRELAAYVRGLKKNQKTCLCITGHHSDASHRINGRIYRVTEIWCTIQKIHLKDFFSIFFSCVILTKWFIQAIRIAQKYRLIPLQLS